MSGWGHGAARWRAPVIAAGLGFAACTYPKVLMADAPPQPALSDPAPAKSDKSDGQSFAIHVQATAVLQYHPAFRSPYEGRNSLMGAAETSETVNASLILGWRPWKGGQFWFDEEMNQGFAPSNTEGVAGYVNGEGAKVGHRSPYYRPQRLFYRQTIDL